MVVVSHLLSFPLSRHDNSPYTGNRCKHLHDPRVMASPDVVANSIVILEQFAKAAKDGNIIPDRLCHHQVISMKQVNPIVSPFIWKNSIENDDNDVTPTTMIDPEDIWAVSYNLVCNHPPASDCYLGAAIDNILSPSVSFADALNGVVSELQKLSMVMLIRGHGGGDYQDFEYGHKNCKIIYSYCFLFTLFSAAT
jgi:hypothetical protein